MSDSIEPTTDAPAAVVAPKPLNPRQRRILGVLIEKARTTPDAYPLSLNGLVTGCNQKSNRSPLMNLTSEQVEDELISLRELGAVAEVHSGGRVPKYRHYGHDFLGVKGVESAVLTELLLRGEQTAGDLRSRASRFEPIADLATLNSILESLMSSKLAVSLTPPGRGQVFSHNFYSASELEQVKANAIGGLASDSQESTGSSSGSTSSASLRQELETVKEQLTELRETVAALADRVQLLES